MATSSTSVSLGSRQALRLVEVYVKTFVAVFLGQLLLAWLATGGVVTLSDAKKAIIAAVAAVIQTLLAALGFAVPSGNPNTTSLLPSRLDPATPPNAPLPVNPGTPDGPLGPNGA